MVQHKDAFPGMEAADNNSHVFADYAALLRAFLPGVLGFYCYGKGGASIWSAAPNPTIGLTPAYEAALAALLNEPSANAARVELVGAVAYLVTLRNEKDESIAALAILMPADARAMTADSFAQLILPASRTLQRELSLRVRLLEGYRKLNVQATEERLLHDVERAVQGPPDSAAMLGRILALCSHYLQVRSAAVLIPDKKIALVHGEALTEPELKGLRKSSGESPDGESDDLYTVRIRGADRARIGMLVLAGWNGPDFSARRRFRVGRYVATHIESVLERCYDNLTGLMAWPVFEKLMATTVAECAGQAPALMYFDIDRLHVANDTLGREVGDQVLARFGAILREEVAGHATTRIASDRFAALLQDTNLKTARELGERIAARFSRLEFGEGDRRYRASVSIGIGSVAAHDRLSADDDAPVDGGGLATAQIACGAAKDRGRGRVEVYQPADLSIVQRFDDIQLVGAIRYAIDNGRLALLGQPIVRIKPAAEGQGHSYCEVLVRMLGEDDQQISPSEFLSAAERYQLMEDLDRWVVANSLQLLSASLARLAPAKARFAINLSGQSLGSEAFLGFVQQQLERSRVPPEMLCFEITETVAVANLQRAQTFMHTLRKTGCRFSLDDFGTGLSSFAYLKLFPVDTLKIDGSFIRDLTTNVVSQSVVAAVSEVARVMQLETVAEFVGDEATLALLGKLGVTWAQGYLFGEPTLLTERIASVPENPALDGHRRSADVRGA